MYILILALVYLTEHQVSADLQQTAHFPNILLLFQHRAIGEKFPDPMIIIFLLSALTLTLEFPEFRQ